MNQEAKDRFATKYRRAVESWGEERVQEDVPILPMQPKRIKRGQKNEFSQFETYVALSRMCLDSRTLWGFCEKLGFVKNPMS